MRQIAKSAIRRPAPGFSFIEIAIITTIILLLSGFVLQRLIRYQRDVEVAAVQYTVSNLRSVLLVNAARLVAQNRHQEIALFDGQNPMEWLPEKPHNYHGIYFDPTPEELPKSGWYFDKKTKNLVYLLNKGKTFPAGIPKSMKFKVKFDYSPQRPAEKQFDYSVTNVSIIQVDGK